MLADVYLSAYERSRQRYAAIVKLRPEPDPLRLRYREQVRAMVRAIVVEGDADIGEYVAGDTDPDTHERLRQIVYAELANLHEGNALRF